MVKKVFLLPLIGIIGIILWSSIFAAPATSQQVEFRVYNLESDVRRLELRLNQIELLINKQTQITSSKIPQHTNQNPNSERRLSPGERDKMFDRLSTLFVELKQQVNALEKRLEKMEI
jgi:hypothetical protein